MMSYLALADKQLRFIVQDCALQVYEGIPLSKALQAYHDFFGDFIIQMVYVGEESGTLGRALEKLTVTLYEYDSFNKRLRAALITPCVTFILFLLLFFVIFFVVIPRFQIMFTGQQHALPLATRIIFGISAGIRSPTFLLVAMCILFAIILAGILLFFVERCKKVKEKLLLCTPGIAYCIHEYSRIQFLQSLGMLLDGGIPLVKALVMSSEVVSVSVLKNSTMKSLHSSKEGPHWPMHLLCIKSCIRVSLMPLLRQGLQQVLWVS
jgi:general secretion pathway protein F